MSGVVTLVMGVGNVSIAIALSLLTGWGFYVAAAGAIVLTMKNALFIPWYAKKVLGIEVHTFTRSMLSGVAATIIIGILAATLGVVLPLASPVMLVVAGVSVTLVYLAVCGHLASASLSAIYLIHIFPKTHCVSIF